MWLHLQKYTSSSAFGEKLDTETYINEKTFYNEGWEKDEIEEWSTQYAEGWYEEVNRNHEHTNHGGSVKHEWVENPPIEWIQKEIEYSRAKLTHIKKYLAELNQLNKAEPTNKIIAVAKSKRKYKKGDKVFTHLKTDYPELTIEKYELVNGKWFYSFKESIILIIGENHLYQAS